MDEVGVPLCPKTGKLLGVTDEKNNYFVSSGQDKKNITVLPTYSADGNSIRPIIVYPYIRFPPKYVAKSAPPGYVIGHSASGNMTRETFTSFIVKGSYSDLVKNKTKLPVLLLFDGHKSHISMEVHEFCKSKGIILYLLYPNSTHILQPCDVGIFRPLKIEWRKVVAARAQKTTAPITKTTYAPLLHEAFSKARQDIKVIQSAFLRCGLYPFDDNAVNYTPNSNNSVIDESASVQSVNESSNGSTNSQTHSNVVTNTNDILHVVEKNISVDLLRMFEEAYEKNEIPSEETQLFNTWKDVKCSLTNIRDSSVPTEVIVEDINQSQKEVMQGDSNEIYNLEADLEAIEIIDQSLPRNTSVKKFIYTDDKILTDKTTTSSNLKQVSSSQEPSLVEVADNQSSSLSFKQVRILESNSTIHSPKPTEESTCEVELQKDVEVCEKKSHNLVEKPISSLLINDMIPFSTQDDSLPIDLSNKNVDVQGFAYQDSCNKESHPKEMSNTIVEEKKNQ